MPPDTSDSVFCVERLDKGSWTLCDRLFRDIDSAKEFIGQSRNHRIVALDRSNRVRYCLNPECKAPCFFVTKKGQEYCSDACAQLGKRRAKRRWWNENRGKSMQLVS